MSKKKPFYMSDEEIRVEVERYGEHSFDSLPQWLQQELHARQLTWIPRTPTEYEQFETINDAIEHRLYNNEMTAQDHINLFKGVYRHV